MRRILVLISLLALLASGGRAQSPSFDLVVRSSNKDVRELLEQHLELKRYREVSDLDDAELTRLIAMAEKDARELLATQGFFAPEIRISRESGVRPQIVVTVEPRIATTVTAADLQFTGDIATSTDSDAIAQRDGIRSGWLLPPGRGFTQQRWDEAKSTASRALIARRYPAGRIGDSLADVDAATNSARLSLRFDSGPLYRLGPMQVTGVERYDPVIIPRLARLAPGSIYDQEQIVQAQLRLAGSGYFDSAFIFVDPQGDPAAAPVQVTVREAPLQKVVLGVGLTTDSGARATVEHTHNRVPVIDWRAVTKLQLERKNPFAQTEFTAIPDEKGWRWGVLARAERIDDDRLVTHGQRLRVGRSKADDRIDRNVYLQYERATVQNPRNVVLTPLDTGVGSAISAHYLWKRRDFNATALPTDGEGLAIEFGGGLTLAGDRKLYQRTVVRWLGFEPLKEGRVQLRAELGAVIAHKQARIPATQLFRTGGDNTVRGYKYLDIGVPLPGGYVGPGRYMAVGSAEWQRPLRRGGQGSNLESLAFIDAGAVADKPGELRPHVGVGGGVRWKSPVGPVDVALAYGVKAHKLRLHITAGFVF